jgi:ABC-2 type transport system ATP-binding protein
MHLRPAPSPRTDSRRSAASSTGDLCPGRGRRAGGRAAEADTTSRGPDRVHGFLLPDRAAREPRTESNGSRLFPCPAPHEPARDTNDDRDHERTEDRIDAGTGSRADASRRAAAAGEQPALLIEHATKRFVVGRKKRSVVAVNDVSMSIRRGEIYGVLGANGSGKSTLIRLISTLLTIDAGRVEVLGHDVESDEMAVKRLINRVSVDAAFFKKLSPHENLAYAARLYGLDARAARAESIRILARLGIGEKRLGRPLEQMSRGMQQKVAIARALLTSPTVLLLDEPTTGLDPRSKLDVQAFIEEVRDTHDATIVLTTHDLAEAERLCDRIALINDGRLVAEGTPDELKGLVERDYGKEPTLENVFMTFTGRSLDDDLGDEDQGWRATTITRTEVRKEVMTVPSFQNVHACARWRRARGGAAPHDPPGGTRAWRPPRAALGRPAAGAHRHLAGERPDDATGPGPLRARTVHRPTINENENEPMTIAMREARASLPSSSATST